MQYQPLEERPVEHATRLREEAKMLPPGAVREAILKRAEQAETGARKSQWLRLPGSEEQRVMAGYYAYLIGVVCASSSSTRLTRI